MQRASAEETEEGKLKQLHLSALYIAVSSKVSVTDPAVSCHTWLQNLKNLMKIHSNINENSPQY